MAVPQLNWDQLVETARKYDLDKDGHLTRNELLPLLTDYLGYDASPYVNEVMLIADMDGSGTINNLQELDIALRKTGTIELTTLFRKYDKDGKFGLTKEELTPLLEEILGYSPGSFADDVMVAGDSNNSGTIDTVNELYNALQETYAIQAWVLQNEFKYYDDRACSDGFITQEDIVKITEGMPAARKEELVTTFKKADVNGDGKVSMQEYIQHMLKK